jgi:L-histidine N-alpha-methyltransferase
MTIAPTVPSTLDLSPDADSFLGDVIAGLSSRPRELPCKYFYDERGSRLFDRICELPEYYPTGAELEILATHAPDMARHLGPGRLLVELGSGSSVKTRLLLDHLIQPAGYVPVDISLQHLDRSAAALAVDYPALEISPVSADYSTDDAIPLPFTAPGAAAVFFPGSSIGNFSPEEATSLLGRIAQLVGPGGSLLIGIDLKKDPNVIQRAYNDAAGVTGEFNRNILRRINRELRGEFLPEAWHHHAFYEPVAGRVEMHLVSQVAQSVRIGDLAFSFEEGETIRTECSYKYTVEQFAEMASGFEVDSVWTDDGRRFAVLLLRAGQFGPGGIVHV